MATFGKDYYRAADLMLKGLGLKPTTVRRNILVAQIAGEKPAGQPFQHFNPLNTTLNMGSTYDWGSQGNIAGFPNEASGIAANVKTLQQSNFSGLRHALETGNPNAFGHALATEPWGTSAQNWGSIYHSIAGGQPPVTSGAAAVGGGGGQGQKGIIDLTGLGPGGGGGGAQDPAVMRQALSMAISQRHGPLDPMTVGNIMDIQTPSGTAGRSGFLGIMPLDNTAGAAGAGPDTGSTGTTGSADTPPAFYKGPLDKEPAREVAFAAATGAGGPDKWASQVAKQFGLEIMDTYRAPAHNAAVGGSPTSRHMTHGGAADISGSAGRMAKLADWAMRSGLFAEVFYDPIGQWDNGRFSRTPIGGHSDHVHLSFGAPAESYFYGGK